MILKVLQHHIDRGKQTSATECPIALAFAEQVKLPPGAWLCGVASYGIDIQRTGWRTITISHDHPRWVRRFDAHGADGVKPIEIELDLPWEGDGAAECG